METILESPPSVENNGEICFGDDKVEKLKKDFLMLKKKIFCSQDLIQKYTLKLKEVEKLKIDLTDVKTGKKILEEKLKKQNISLQSETVKLKLENEKLKQTHRELMKQNEDKEIKIASDKQHIEQLICKIKHEEDVHTGKILSMEIEKSELGIRIKDLEHELRNCQRREQWAKQDKAIARNTLKKRGRPLKSPKVNGLPLICNDSALSESDDDDCRPLCESKSDLDQKSQENLDDCKDNNSVLSSDMQMSLDESEIILGNDTKIDISDISTVMKPIMCDKNIMTDEFYHIKDNPYPLFCDKCQASLNIVPVNEIFNNVSTLPLIPELPPSPRNRKLNEATHDIDINIVQNFERFEEKIERLQKQITKMKKTQNRSNHIAPHHSYVNNCYHEKSVIKDSFSLMNLISTFCNNMIESKSKKKKSRVKKMRRKMRKIHKPNYVMNNWDVQEEVTAIEKEKISPVLTHKNNKNIEKNCHRLSPLINFSPNRNFASSDNRYLEVNDKNQDEINMCRNRVVSNSENNNINNLSGMDYDNTHNGVGNSGESMGDEENIFSSDFCNESSIIDFDENIVENSLIDSNNSEDDNSDYDFHEEHVLEIKPDEETGSKVNSHRKNISNVHLHEETNPMINSYEESIAETHNHKETDFNVNQENDSEINRREELNSQIDTPDKKITTVNYNEEPNSRVDRHEKDISKINSYEATTLRINYNKNGVSCSDNENSDQCSHKTIGTTNCNNDTLSISNSIAKNFSNIGSHEKNITKILTYQKNFSQMNVLEQNVATIRFNKNEEKNFNCNNFDENSSEMNADITDKNIKKADASLIVNSTSRSISNIDSHKKNMSDMDSRKKDISRINSNDETTNNASGNVFEKKSCQINDEVNNTSMNNNDLLTQNSTPNIIFNIDSCGKNISEINFGEKNVSRINFNKNTMDHLNDDIHSENTNEINDIASDISINNCTSSTLNSPTEDVSNRSSSPTMNTMLLRKRKRQSENSNPPSKKRSTLMAKIRKLRNNNSTTSTVSQNGNLNNPIDETIPAGKKRIAHTPKKKSNNESLSPGNNTKLLHHTDQKGSILIEENTGKITSNRTFSPKIESTFGVSKKITKRCEIKDGVKSIAMSVTSDDDEEIMKEKGKDSEKNFNSRHPRQLRIKGKAKNVYSRNSKKLILEEKETNGSVIHQNRDICDNSEDEKQDENDSIIKSLLETSVDTDFNKSTESQGVIDSIINAINNDNNINNSSNNNENKTNEKKYTNDNKNSKNEVQNSNNINKPVEKINTSLDEINNSIFNGVIVNSVNSSTKNLVPENSVPVVTSPNTTIIRSTDESPASPDSIEQNNSIENPKALSMYEKSSIYTSVIGFDLPLSPMSSSSGSPEKVDKVDNSSKKIEVDSSIFTEINESEENVQIVVTENQIASSLSPSFKEKKVSLKNEMTLDVNERSNVANVNPILPVSFVEKDPTLDKFQIKFSKNITMVGEIQPTSFVKKDLTSNKPLSTPNAIETISPIQPVSFVKDDLTFNPPNLNTIDRLEARLNIAQKNFKRVEFVSQTLVEPIPNRIETDKTSEKPTQSHILPPIVTKKIHTPVAKKISQPCDYYTGCVKTLRNRTLTIGQSVNSVQSQANASINRANKNFNKNCRKSNGGGLNKNSDETEGHKKVDTQKQIQKMTENGDSEKAAEKHIEKLGEHENSKTINLTRDNKQLHETSDSTKVHANDDSNSLVGNEGSNQCSEGTKKTEERVSKKISFADPEYTITTMLHEQLVERKRISGMVKVFKHARIQVANKIVKEVEDQVLTHMNNLLNAEHLDNTINRETVNNLKTINTRSIVKVIIDLITQRAKSGEPLDRTFTPPAPIMTKTAQKLIAFIQKLEEEKPIICDILTAIEYTLFHIKIQSIETEVSDYPASEELARLFTVLAKIRKDRERVRIFCCDALYCLQKKGLLIIYTVVTSWPEVFPIYNENNYQYLPICLAYAVDLYILENSNEEMCSKIIQLRKLIKSYYQYPREVTNPKNFINKLLTELPNIGCDRSLFTAILIVAKKEGVKWTNQNIIHGKLLQLIVENKIPNVYEALKLLGFLLKCFPAVDLDGAVNKIADQLCDILDSKSASADIQEGAVFALLSLIKNKFSRVYRSILAWHPPRTLPSELNDQLQKFFNIHNAATWRKLVNKLEKWKKLTIT